MTPSNCQKSQRKASLHLNLYVCAFEGCFLVEIETFCLQNYKLYAVVTPLSPVLPQSHLSNCKATTALLEALMQPHECRADIPLCHQNKQEIGNFNWRCGWCAMRPLENEYFWQVWTKARPKTADGGKAADVNVVIFFHMFFCFAVISTLYFNCQWLKTWENHIFWEISYVTLCLSLEREMQKVKIGLLTCKLAKMKDAIASNTVLSVM